MGVEIDVGAGLGQSELAGLDEAAESQEGLAPLSGIEAIKLLFELVCHGRWRRRRSWSGHWSDRRWSASLRREHAPVPATPEGALEPGHPIVDAVRGRRKGALSMTAAGYKSAGPKSIAKRGWMDQRRHLSLVPPERTGSLSP